MSPVHFGYVQFAQWLRDCYDEAAAKEKKYKRDRSFWRQRRETFEEIIDRFVEAFPRFKPIQAGGRVRRRS